MVINEKRDNWSILFVCMGNICRSPAAEIIFRQMVQDAGQERRFIVDSAGTTGYHAGAQPDARMRSELHKHGYKNTGLRARKVRVEDFTDFDLILAMDGYNYDDLIELRKHAEGEATVMPMCKFAQNHPDDHVPDPYYGGAGGFTHVVRLLEDACGNLLRQLDEKT